jgi:hypothetical protein
MAVDLGLGNIAQSINKSVRAANSIDYGPVQDPGDIVRDYGLGDWGDVITPELRFVWGVSKWGDLTRRVGK